VGKNNPEVAKLQTDYAAGVPEGERTYNRLVLDEYPYREGFPRESRLAYAPSPAGECRGGPGCAVVLGERSEQPGRNEDGFSCRVAGTAILPRVFVESSCPAQDA
jgi:hypothetical protein